jgi:hypothetical protein
VNTVIPPVAPTPNTALVASQKSLELTLAPEIGDRLALQYQNKDISTPYPLDIQSWHTTLENGFRNGFQSAFRAKQGPSADLTLRIDKADLEVGDFDHGVARITYAATLTGADGTVRRTSGIASRGVASKHWRAFGRELRPRPVHRLRRPRGVSRLPGLRERRRPLRAVRLRQVSEPRRGGVSSRP